MVQIKQHRSSTASRCRLLNVALALLCLVGSLVMLLLGYADVDASNSWQDLLNGESTHHQQHSSSQGDWHETLRRAVSEQRKHSTARALSKPCSKLATLVETGDGINAKTPALSCSSSPMPPVYYCGHYDDHNNPYIWECRLKERVISRIKEHILKACAFGGLDIGTASGDWVLAIGAQTNASVFASVEASPTYYDAMYTHLGVNPGLVERVSAYNAAVSSWSTYQGLRDAGVAIIYDDAHGWRGPSICVKDKDTTGQMGLDNSSQCTTDQVLVPVVTVDSIMSDWANGASKPGNLFFAKLDIEGMEAEALLGGNSTFSSSETRPCFVYIEMKRDARRKKERKVIYDKAFEILTSVYGYTEFEDIDSGLSGPESYPPQGTIWPLEGNYEFRLSGSELKLCAERVRLASC